MKKALVVVFSPLLFKMWVKCVGNEEKLQNGTMEKHFFLISEHKAKYIQMGALLNWELRCENASV